VNDKIEKAGAVQRRLFKRALTVGRKYHSEYLSKGKRPPLPLKLEYETYDKTLFSLVRKQLGLENGNFFPTAGSYVSSEVEEFTHSVGICMIVGYGLTESLATVSCDHKGEPYTIGSVGRPIEGIEIRIGENDEILLKGPTITKGYYKRDGLNEQSFTEDGFFKTGDAGYLRNGELFLKERIKELFKTSNGKYIAPQMIESRLLVDKFIEQLAVIADQRKFVSALIVPAFGELEEYAKEQGIAYHTKEDLCKNPQIIQMLTERIETLQQQLANYEKIKRFILLPKPFTMESGELTNTLKIKRAVLNKNYAEQIEEMYKE
jgi:long-chain acyl-CoA synthetase